MEIPPFALLPRPSNAALRAEEELFSERMLGIFLCCTAATVTKIVDFPPAALTGAGFEVGWGGDFPPAILTGEGFEVGLRGSGASVYGDIVKRL